jgi:uncharacterized membrane protein YheB (UPF0754 family)
MLLEHNTLLLAIIPIISASIGWFTNYIAIKMLFYPRVKRNFLLFELHGVFPKRQKEMAVRLGEIFAEELGVQDTIESSIKELFSESSAGDVIRSKVNNLAHSFISREIPFLASMVPTDMIDSLSTEVADSLKSSLEEEISSGALKLSGRLDIKKMVQSQIESLDAESLEIMLQNLLRREFRFIELSGAFLGFLIGCVQLVIGSFIY